MGGRGVWELYNFWQVCSEDDSQQSFVLMKELLDQRLQEYAGVAESEQPSTLFILRRWHRELEQKAEVREQDVGASVIDLEVSCHPVLVSCDIYSLHPSSCTQYAFPFQINPGLLFSSLSLSKWKACWKQFNPGNDLNYSDTFFFLPKRISWESASCLHLLMILIYEVCHGKLLCRRISISMSAGLQSGLSSCKSWTEHTCKSIHSPTTGIQLSLTSVECIQEKLSLHMFLHAKFAVFLPSHHWWLCFLLTGYCPLPTKTGGWRHGRCGRTPSMPSKSPSTTTFTSAASPGAWTWTRQTRNSS